MNVFKVYKLLLSGFKDTSEILGQVLAKFTSDVAGKIKAAALLMLVSVMLYISFGFIDLFINSRDTGQMTEASEMIFDTVLTVAVSNGGVDALNLILWGSMIAALTLPLVSNSLLSSYNRSSMVSIKKNDVYKITDSIVLQYSSILTLVQLFILIMFFSIIRYTYELPSFVYVYAILIWLLFGLITVFLAWVLDFVLRMYGPTVKFLFVIFEFLLVGYLFFLLPSVAENFFGLSTLLVTSFSSVPTLFISILIGFIVGLVLLYGIAVFGLKTLNQTIPYVKPSKQKKANYKQGQLVLAWRVLLRNGNVRSPILLMQGIIIASLVISNNAATVVSFVFALPMVITLATFINIYGLMGSGNSWLFSLKSFTNKSLVFFGLINLQMIFVAMSIVTLAAYVFNVFTLENSIRFLSASMVAASLMTLCAGVYAVLRPNKYDVHVRGENILPPSKSLFVLGILITIGGLPAIYSFSILGVTGLLISFAISITLCLTVLALMNKKLASGLNANRIISQTA